MWFHLLSKVVHLREDIINKGGRGRGGGWGGGGDLREMNYLLNDITLLKESV